jgi:3-deoxy-D-manno-octulosonic-acid transferase
MLIVYRILINFIFILSPIIILIRLLKKKEDLHRFKEKIGFFSKRKKNGKLIWFHGASVGELQSVIPIIEILEKDKKISQILITSNTLSSSKVIKRYKFKKVIHQFFPIDQNLISKNFIDYWRPSLSLFIDSEIWPNMLTNLKKKNIPIILLNGRISKKTYKKWYFFESFSKSIIGKFNLCLSSNNKSKNYLKKLGANNVKFLGNLKFSQSENENISINKKFKKFISKKRVWCASSTHYSEEKICGVVHKKLSLKYKNLLTIIIPRHIDRIEEIKNQLEQIGLNVHIHESQKKIDNKTDIYLVNSYGTTKSFYSVCKNVFLGGSLINHGGQNPLEAVRYGCNILHGPNVENFDEIYEFLKKNKISNKINDDKKMIYYLEKFFSQKNSFKKTQKKIVLTGNKILKSTYNAILMNL